MSRKKILVIDDEKIIRDTFVAAFNEYEIIGAASGKEALALLRQQSDISLLVLDFKIPGINGASLLTEIKQTYPRQKVVMLTGYDTKELTKEILSLDVDALFEKPFDIYKVRETFRQLLDSEDKSKK